LEGPVTLYVSVLLIITGYHPTFKDANPMNPAEEAAEAQSAPKERTGEDHIREQTPARLHLLQPEMGTV
jgi:hypothetical protein